MSTTDAETFADLIAATVKYWERHMRDANGDAIPVPNLHLFKDAIDPLDKSYLYRVTPKDMMEYVGLLLDDPICLQIPERRREIEGLNRINAHKFDFV